MKKTFLIICLLIGMILIYGCERRMPCPRKNGINFLLKQKLQRTLAQTKARTEANKIRKEQELEEAVAQGVFDDNGNVLTKRDIESDKAEM